ncbi:MAG TPA: IS66 family transposase [Blastocatellia bacterium]|nr:IS66 family transposase [Blastocatellia bacterium]
MPTFSSAIASPLFFDWRNKSPQVFRNSAIIRAATMTLTTEQLDKFTREELLELVIRQQEIIALLQAEVAALKAELEKFRRPPATSRNSSRPPSLDRKANSDPQRKKRKKSRRGHARQTRPLVDNPDQIIPVPVTECQSCQANLAKVKPERIIRRQVTEIPPVKPFIIETQQHEVLCPHCHQINRGLLPESLEADRFFGPKLAARVVYYKQTQHLSYERIVATMRDLYGVDLSEGGIAAMLRRAGECAKPVAEQIKEQVSASRVIKSDETSARVKGRNWWQWVFVGLSRAYHHIGPTRSAAEIRAVLGDRRVEKWVSDCFTAQLKAPAKEFQLCLAHQLRDLDRVIEIFPKQSWAKALKVFFRRAIHLRNRFHRKEPMTTAGYVRRVFQLESELDELLSRPVHNPGARNLKERFLTHRDKLLVFLHDPDVPPTNNESERALRTSVIHRKVTNCFRSEWGAKAYAALQSVIATARLKGENIFDALVKLMGKPIDRYLQPSSP